MIRVFIIVWLALLPLTTPAPAQTQPDDAKWKMVASWKGNGIKQTESFETSTREWRLTWESKNEPFANAGILQIFVHKDSNDELVSLAANKQGPGKDVSYVRGAGRHYLKINSANIDWAIAVQERR